MNRDIATILRTNLDFVKDHSNVNLEFVYLQMDNLTKLIGNDELMRDLKDLVDQVFDRDKNGIFDEKDVKLIKDIFTNKQNQLLNIYSFVMEIFNAILSMIGKAEKVVLKLDKEAMEGVFFGTLAYVMFQFGGSNEDERQDILDIMIAILNIIRTVDNTFGITKKILDLLRKKGWCKCLFTDDDHKIEREIIRSRERVRQLAVSVKDNEKMRVRVVTLEKKLEEM